MTTSKYIWVPDKEYEWILADIVEDHGETVNVSINRTSNVSINNRSLIQLDGKLSTEGKQVKIRDNIQTATLKRNTLCEFDSTHLEDLDDLCLMGNLHEGPLIHILRRRWLQDHIYTYAGDILISINPYKLIPELYDNPLAYYDPQEIPDVKQPPHVYVVANNALKKLAAAQPYDKIINQSVIISGESGAGKTEASKYMISYLIHVNNHINQSSPRASKDLSMKDLVLNSGIVFESFGNAKTVQNDNSSRFGKYIKLQYTNTNELVSATNETFLLEKSRLITVGSDERNYHVFYQLVRGIESINSQAKVDLVLPNVESFRILTSGGCTIIRDAEMDTHDFVTLYNALLRIGCIEEDLTSLWGLLAAILHLGNTDFSEPCEATKGKLGINVATTTVKHIADLLGVEEEDFMVTLTTQSIKAMNRQSIKIKTLTVAESTNSVLALIKRLYSGIFAWLLQTINDNHSSLIDKDRAPVKFLGILDICGFEILKSNSFEQLCINFTNERLQQQFNDSVFASEQELYKKEGIAWTTIDFHDNQNVIDLIVKKPSGLLNLLDEHCMMNRAPDDLAILGLYHQTHGERPDKIYQKPRFSKDPTFILKHFAGSVTYQIDGFIGKNYDSLQDSLSQLMLSSSNPVIIKVMTAITIASAAASIPSPTNSSVAAAANGGARASKVASLQTVSSSVRSQLDALINALKNTEPHFVKVFKPNDIKQGDVFNTPSIMSQLRCSDIIEVIRIRRERFQIRMKFIEFYSRYEIFSRIYRGDWKKPSECDDVTAKGYCKLITERYLPVESYQFGHTMIFLHDTGLSTIQIAVGKITSQAIVKIQAFTRGFLAMKFYQRFKSLLKQLSQEKEEQLALKRQQEELEKERLALRRIRELGDEEILRQRQIEEEAKELLQRLEAEAEMKRLALKKENADEEERKRLQYEKMSDLEKTILELQRLLEEKKAELEKEKTLEEDRLRAATQREVETKELIEKDVIEQEKQRQVIRENEEEIQKRALLLNQSENEGELKFLEKQKELERQKQVHQQKEEEIKMEMEKLKHGRK